MAALAKATLALALGGVLGAGNGGADDFAASCVMMCAGGGPTGWHGRNTGICFGIGRGIGRSWMSCGGALLGAGGALTGEGAALGIGFGIGCGICRSWMNMPDPFLTLSLMT